MGIITISDGYSGSQEGHDLIYAKREVTRLRQYCRELREWGEAMKKIALKREREIYPYKLHRKNRNV